MNQFSADLKVYPHFSRKLLLIFSLITTLAAITVVTLALNIWIKGLLITAILIWFYITINEHCWHNGSAITEAELKKDGSWLLSFNKDQKSYTQAQLLSGCLVQPWLTVLQFKIPNQRRRSLILLKDNVDPDVFRRLRVRLLNV